MYLFTGASIMRRPCAIIIILLLFMSPFIYRFTGTGIMRRPLKQAHWNSSMIETCLVASAV